MATKIDEKDVDLIVIAANKGLAVAIELGD